MSPPGPHSGQAHVGGPPPPLPAAPLTGRGVRAHGAHEAHGPSQGPPGQRPQRPRRPGTHGERRQRRSAADARAQEGGGTDFPAPRPGAPYKGPAAAGGAGRAGAGRVSGGTRGSARGAQGPRRHGSDVGPEGWPGRTWLQPGGGRTGTVGVTVPSGVFRRRAVAQLVGDPRGACQRICLHVLLVCPECGLVLYPSSRSLHVHTPGNPTPAMPCSHPQATHPATWQLDGSHWAGG